MIDNATNTIPKDHSMNTADTNIENDEAFQEAARALFETLSPERQARAERRGKGNAKYVTMPKDALIASGIDQLCENAAAALFGEPGKRRALWLLGESDSGKTRAMEYHIPKRPEFRPRLSKTGTVIRPFVSFEAPRPITTKGFARKALEACGYPVANSKLTEQELFELLKATIRNNGVLFMHIDEMQHVLKGTTTNEIQNVSDIIKSLLQIPGWPLHLILSGVPSLARFLMPEDGDSQLRNRSIIVELKQITKGDAETILKLQKHIMSVEDVHMETDTVEMMERLIHACNGACGTIIQTMLAAAEDARAVHVKNSSAAVKKQQTFDEAVPTVTVKNYAKVYANNTGCRQSENVFVQEDWRSIDPRHSLAAILSRAKVQEKQKNARNGSKSNMGAE